MPARRFPANFSDTENDLECKSHQAKDSVFVVDDFKPEGGQVEASKNHAKLARFIRNTGNNAGRGRRDSNLQAKAAPYNRSLSIITAEDTARGQSIVGRTVMLEIGHNDVECSRLTQLQEAAQAGQLAGLTAAYIQWLCPHIDQLKRNLPQKIIEYRSTAIQSGNFSSHPRAPEIFASLVAGAAIFIDFLKSSGAIGSERADVLIDEIETGLQQAFKEQAAYQIEQDETERFLALLRALFSAGNAHIACRLNQGPPPSRPHSWGWREVNSGLGEKDYRPMGNCIGWYCDKGDTGAEVWLEQNNAFAAVQKMARDQGEGFLMAAPTLWRRMHEKGLILVTEQRPSGQPQLTVKRAISSVKRRVMVLSAHLIESEA